VIQAAVRRHGFCKALAWWGDFGQEKVFQLFIHKHQELAGNLAVQLDGKGDFLKVRVELDSLGKLKLRGGEVNMTIDLAARDPACSVGPPKRHRFGHPHCLRIDNNLPKAKRRHFVVDMGCPKVLHRWKTVCLQHAKEKEESAQMAVARGAMDAACKVMDKYDIDIENGTAAGLQTAAQSMMNGLFKPASPVKATAVLLPPAATAATAQAVPGSTNQRWVSDKEVTHCTVCMQGFSALQGRFKHHCRACGCVACGSCSEGQAVLEQWFDDQPPHALQLSRSHKPLRVCGTCHASGHGQVATMTADKQP